MYQHIASKINHFNSKMADSNYLDIRSLYHSNYSSTKYHIRFSPNASYYILFVIVVATSSPNTKNEDNVAVIYGVVIGMSLLVLLVLIVLVVAFYCYYLDKSKNNRHQTDHLPDLMGSPISLAPVEGIDNVELIKQVGRGRFATVWKAVMNNSSVAIKIFPVFNVESYSHERDIYTTPFFEHDYLLHFIGAEQRTVGYETQYWLVTAYHEYGSLLDFLRVRTVSLENLCMMAESIAMGLSHLHCTFTRNGKYKPAIVHRDFKSKNILVKEDLTCAISDFGLAFKFVSGESPVEAQGQVSVSVCLLTCVLYFNSIHVGCKDPVMML